MALTCLLLAHDAKMRSRMEAFAAKTGFMEIAGQSKDTTEAVKWLRNHTVNLILCSSEEFGKSMPDLMAAEGNFSFVVFGPSDIYQVDKFFIRPWPLEPDMRDVPARQESDAFYIRAEGRIHRIAYQDLHAAEALGDYLQLHLENGLTIRVAQRLGNLTEYLPGHLFMRVHKSWIVRFGAIIGLEGNRLFTQAGEVPVGAAYRDLLIGRIRPV